MPAPTDGYTPQKVSFSIAIDGAPVPIFTILTCTLHVLIDIDDALVDAVEVVKARLEDLYPSATVTVQRTYAAEKNVPIP